MGDRVIGFRKRAMLSGAGLCIIVRRSILDAGTKDLARRAIEGGSAHLGERFGGREAEPSEGRICTLRLSRLVQECRVAGRAVSDVRPPRLVQKLVQGHLVQKKSQVAAGRTAT